MTLKLYYADISPAVRATLLVVKVLGVDVELKPVNLKAGEQKTAEFVKKNPLHTVPILEDGDFAMWDSHAINCYLVGGQIWQRRLLYPKDLQKRAIIHQRLHFNSGILLPRVAEIVSLLKAGAKSVSKDKADMLTNAYSQLETLLEKSTYIAGDQLSLADFSIISAISSANALVPIASNRFPKTTDYISRMKALPYYAEANQVGLDKFTSMVKNKQA